MAQFTQQEAKNIANHFEKIGYPLIAFNKNEGRSIIDEKTGYRIIDSKATIKGVKKNDVWDIYYSPSAEDWYWRNAIELDSNGVPSIKDGYESYLRVELVDKGSTFLDDEEYDNEEYEVANEFANFEDFDSINAPDYSLVYGDDPQVSVASPMVNIDELTASQLKKAEQKLESAKEALAELKKAEKTEDIENAMWTFDEVDELYNSKISDDDKIAYFIYLQNKNRKKLTGDWANKYGSSYPAQATTILSLMKKGCLFYDPSANLGERLQPRVIYKSGNVWQKYGNLSSKKDEYIKRFGQAIYDLHTDNLDWQTLNANRLKVRGEKEVRLQILPISVFAEDFKINGIISPKDKETIKKNFNIYTSFTKDGLKQDLLKDDGNDSQFIRKDVVTLREGFILWLKDAGTGNQSSEIGINWSASTTDLEQLMDRYIKPVPNPIKQEPNGVDRWLRMKDDAKKVGDRLFAQFMDEGITADDQLKLEFVWNSMYNSYVEPNLDEVPIGFTYKKYLDNRHLFVLKETNLRAVRYYLTRGSMGLAYGVGLGKTFCSIFAMKQALDLGTAKRPLVIVPNQVYFQFGQEILRGLGKDFDPIKENSRLNMFYNGGGVYNLLGNSAVDGINICTYEAVEKFQFAQNNIEMAWVDEAVSVLEMSEGVKNLPLLQMNLNKYTKALFNAESIESDEDSSDEYEDRPVDDENISDLGDYDEGGSVPSKEPIFINIDSTNYDMVVVDEAHNFNNLFYKILGEAKDEQQAKPNKKGDIRIERKKNRYGSLSETSKTKGSARAEKLWFLVRFIQRYNKMGNTILLSATPFTNSPLQVYSMLSFLNYNALKQVELGEISNFFDIFAKIEYAEDFKTDLTLVKRNKFIGFVNLIAFQKLIYRMFDKSSRADEDKAVVRPNKLVLPLKRQLIDGKIVEFAKDNYVSTTIRMSDLQNELWADVRKYASPKEDALPYSELFRPDRQNTTLLGRYEGATTTRTNSDEEEQEEVEIEDTDDLADGTQEEQKVKQAVKSLQCLAWGRQIALNPYLFKGSGFKVNPTGAMYVEASPKLLYVMECIRGIKDYHEKSSDSPRMSGQVIYMNFGTKAFELIRDYLVANLGFNINEIGIIRGGSNLIGKKKYDSKQKVADAFLGRVLDPETGKYTALEDSQRIKVLIGSESIKEGINLQDYASVLYNCFLDFNPTDQVQVEGRIWRQGNAFANVRISTPLMADCIDIFMFQKLEDKTTRINQIWTRNGNLNELDTTAFNPAELKYELLTDPNAIAYLEREYKKEKLEEEKTQVGEQMSSYLTLVSIYKKGLSILYPALNNPVTYDFYFSMYYQISQIRPDLLPKPLQNEEGYKKYIGKVIPTISDYYKERENLRDVDAFFNFYPDIYNWAKNGMYNYLDSDSPYYLTRSHNSMLLWRESFTSIFNYSAEELIQLMVQLLKEQKIAYPIGYSKNWRDLLPKKEIPIVEGDEVEFDTKKGRKKGKAELVMNSRGSTILNSFWSEIRRELNDGAFNRTYLKDSLKEAGAVTTNLIDDNINENTDFDQLDGKELSDLILLLKWMYKNDTKRVVLGDDNEIGILYIPFSLDVDELEDLNIQERNIIRVEKADKEKKKVEPTKYPEPFTWSNKDRDENIKDICEYLAKVQFPKSMNLNYDDYVNFYITAEANERLPKFSKAFKSLPQILISSSNQFSASSLMDFDTDNLSKTWAELVDLWKDTRAGLFRIDDNQFYSADLPLSLNEFRRAEEKKFIPMGINNYQDLENLITEQREKINSLALQQRQLDDPQVFEELVQEVMRKINELNSEEIRKGSSFKARSESFGKPNSDYLGNNLLSIFTNTDQARLENVQKAVEEKMQEQETPIEIAEIQAEEIGSPTQRIIDELLELSEFETPREKKKTMRIIEDLRELMEFE
jgi:hypothetical protein